MITKSNLRQNCGNASAANVCHAQFFSVTFTPLLPLPNPLPKIQCSHH